MIHFLLGFSLLMLILGVPDTSRYQYDETIGYYYDPVSGLYYDANTQYFYDAEKQQFLHWSPKDKKYVAVTASCDDEDDTDKVDILNGDMNKRKTKKAEKPDKVKVAKRIAKVSYNCSGHHEQYFRQKFHIQLIFLSMPHWRTYVVWWRPQEMEKWAKTLNQKKDAFCRQTPVVEPSSSVASSSAAASSSSYSASVSKSSALDQEYVYTAAENLTTYQPAVSLAHNFNLNLNLNLSLSHILDC